MKSFSILLSIIFFTGIVSCKKEKNGIALNNQQKQLAYTGSSEALSEGRYNMQVFQTGDYTCFTGGTVFSLPVSTTISTNTDVYNCLNGAWSRFGMSVKRDYYAEAALNNKLIIAGGVTANSTYSSTADVFDLTTGQATVTNLSQPRAFFAAAAAGNKIVFAGGIPANNKVSARVDIYNTQTGQWTIDSLSLARGNICAGAVGNKIVFAGGVAINSSNGQGYYSDRIDIYDVQTGLWAQATLSQPRYYNMKVITAGNKLLIAGGATTTNNETVDVYDTQTNLWTTITLTGNTLNYYLACTNGSQIFLTSGTGSTFNFTKLHTYNVNTGQLNTVLLPAPIRVSAMAAAANKVVIAAGVIADTATKKIFVYNTQTNKFDSTSFNLPEKKAAVTAATAGNKILFTGGIIDETLPGQPRKVTNFKTVSVFELK